METAGERERPLSDAKRNWRRAHDRWGEFIIIYRFLYHSWGSGNLTMGIYVCPCCMLIFFRKQCFLTNGMQYIYCWWITLLSLFDLYCLKTWGVWISGMKVYISICGMWLTVDVAIDDFIWYVVRLIFMMILIWDNVVNDDHGIMSWYCYWWLC